uniref:Putative ovule protein n=1 Tax=Solanum chacoense TaxID=4108 RepID=A0A0V0I035_SOLCH
MFFELSLLAVHGLASGKQDPFQPENLRILFTLSLSSQTNPAFQLLLQLDYLFLRLPQISFHFLKSQMKILSQLNLDLLLGYGSSGVLHLYFNRSIIRWSLMFLLDSSGTSLDNKSVMKP